MDKTMTVKTEEITMQAIYNLGRKNGALLMRNEILKMLNRNKKLASSCGNTLVLVKMLKKISNINPEKL